MNVGKFCSGDPAVAAVDVHFEPATAGKPSYLTYYQAAFIDTAAPYLVIPHRVHRSGLLRIHRDHGRKPYRLLADTRDFLTQPFAEVGLHFLAWRAEGGLVFEPEPFVPVKAYDLEAGVRPTGRVLIGLEPLYENFLTHLNKPEAYLRVRGQP